MSITDPIADMATLIRNASRAGKDKVDIRASNCNEGIAEILKEEKFITNYKRIPDDKQGLIRIYLRFEKDGRPYIRNIKRISKPGLRIYRKKKDLPDVLGGLGIAIISTPQGLLVDKAAREKNIGGEVLLEVW